MSKMLKERFVDQDGVERQRMEDGVVMMVLLTDEIRDQLKPLECVVVNAEDGDTSRGLAPWDDPIVVCKFFHCVTQLRVYITHGEWDPVQGDWRLFGFQNDPKPVGNWGHVYLGDLESYRCRHGIPFERDKCWTPVPASQVTRNS